MSLVRDIHYLAPDFVRVISEKSLKLHKTQIKLNFRCDLICVVTYCPPRILKRIHLLSNVHNLIFLIIVMKFCRSLKAITPFWCSWESNKKGIHFLSMITSPVGWSCRIHQLHLCRGVGPSQRVFWIWKTNHLLVSLQSWNFGENIIHLNRHFFQLHSNDLIEIKLFYCV